MNDSIHLETGSVVFVNDKVVIVRPSAGVEIDGPTAVKYHAAIAERVPGSYGIIIDREQDYSLSPVSVFAVLNQLPRLKAIAIVAHRGTSRTITAIDKALSRKPLEVFETMSAAQDWIEAALAVSVD